MGFYHQLYTRNAHDFQWYQCQWKTDMRNSTLTFQKKIELVFDVGLHVIQTQFSKKNNNKKITLSPHKLMLILINISGSRHRQNRCVL